MKTRVGLQEDRRRSKPWVVYWFDPPGDDLRQRKRTRSFKYKREALAFQAQKQAEINRNERPELTEDLTLQNFIAEFMKARVEDLSYSSQQLYGRTMDQLVEFFGGMRRLRVIEQRHAEAFITSRKRRDGRPGELAGHTRAQIVKYCRSAFAAAVEWGYIDRNPFVPIRRSSSSSLRTGARNRPWHHILPAEFLAFMQVVSHFHRRAAYWLMYGCGLRPGAAYNMTTDRIDLEHRLVTVANRAPTQDLPPFTVKADGQSATGTGRVVPIPEAAIPDLILAMEQAFKAGGFITLSPARFETVRECWRLCRQGMPWGGRLEWRPWQNRDMVNNLLRDTKAYFAKVDVKLSAPLTLHTFRKSFAQNHADNGTPPKTLAYLMGHSDPAITLEFYNNASDANQQAAASMMDRLLKSNLPKGKAVGE